MIRTVGRQMMVMGWVRTASRVEELRQCRPPVGPEHLCLLRIA